MRLNENDDNVPRSFGEHLYREAAIEYISRRNVIYVVMIFLVGIVGVGNWPISTILGGIVGTVLGVTGRLQQLWVTDSRTERAHLRINVTLAGLAIGVCAGAAVGAVLSGAHERLTKPEHPEKGKYTLPVITSHKFEVEISNGTARCSIPSFTRALAIPENGDQTPLMSSQVQAYQIAGGVVAEVPPRERTRDVVIDITATCPKAAEREIFVQTLSRRIYGSDIN